MQKLLPHISKCKIKKIEKSGYEWFLKQSVNVLEFGAKYGITSYDHLMHFKTKFLLYKNTIFQL